jgi:uncharacterized damage-inducible protein DinB
MTEASRIAGLFRAALNGDPYYGPSLLTVLARVTSDVAAQRQSRAHSIWELVMHMTAEMNYTRDVLDGHVRPWVEGETTWPRITDTSETAWQRSINDLQIAYRELVSRIERLDDGTLQQRRAMPAERSIYEILHGTLQHNIYHTGQISLLLKAHGH